MSRTLTQLLSDVRDLADRGGATTRHTDALVTRALNRAIQRYNLEVNYSGADWNLTTTSGTTTAGTSSYALPTGMVQLYHVEMTDGDVSYALLPYERLERHEFEADYFETDETSRPIWYRLAGGNLVLRPVPDATYTYKLRYLPKATELATGADTFDPDLPIGEDWVTYRAAITLLIKDNDQEHLAGIKMEFRDIDYEVKKHSAARDRVAPRRKIDVRRRRRQGWKHFYPWSS